jgi:hypothetical protein
VYRMYSGATRFASVHATGAGSYVNMDVARPVGLNQTAASSAGAGFSSGLLDTVANWPGGYVRLRFGADATGSAPAAGPVQLIEYYMPQEWSFAATPYTCTTCSSSFCPTYPGCAPIGGTLTTNIDDSAGILKYTATGCPAGNTGCLASPIALDRACVAVANGVVSGSTLTWGTCGIASPALGTKAWLTASSQVDTTSNSGCLGNLSRLGGSSCSGNGCGFELAGVWGWGSQNATWDQKLPSFSFAGANYATTTLSFPEFIEPDTGSGFYNGVSLTGAVASHVECGTLSQLTCDEN